MKARNPQNRHGFLSPHLTVEGHWRLVRLETLFTDVEGDEVFANVIRSIEIGRAAAPPVLQRCLVALTSLDQIVITPLCIFVLGGLAFFVPFLHNSIIPAIIRS